MDPLALLSLLTFAADLASEFMLTFFLSEFTLSDFESELTLEGTMVTFFKEGFI